MVFAKEEGMFAVLHKEPEVHEDVNEQEDKELPETPKPPEPPKAPMFDRIPKSMKPWRVW